MRFLPFQNLHSASGKKEFVEEFCRCISADEIKQEEKKLAQEITEDFYCFMFAFLSHNEFDVIDYKFFIDHVNLQMYIRMFGLLESSQSFIIKKEIYKKLYVYTMEEVTKLRKTPEVFSDLEDVCCKITEKISIKYFELISKLKNYEEPYNCEYYGFWQFGHRKLWSAYYRDNLMEFKRELAQKIATNCLQRLPYIMLFGSIIIAFCAIFKMSDFLTQIMTCAFICAVSVAIYCHYETQKALRNNDFFIKSSTLAWQLGVDTLRMEISENLIPLANPEQKNEMLPDLQKTRIFLTDDYGYIIPNVRVMDNPSLGDNTITLLVREKEVFKFEFYANKFIAQEAVLKLAGIDTEKLKQAKNVYSKAKLFWIDKKLTQKLNNNDYISHRQYFIKTFYELALQHVEKIMTPSSVISYMNLGRFEHEGFNLDPYKYFSLEDLRDILVELLKERISIKDVIFILEKIRIYSSKGLYPEDVIRTLKKELQ